jgi:hypothetical protein
VPAEVPEGWTNNSRLIWEKRFDKIATPTVFYKDNWVKRRLELKELKGVLDIHAMEECGTAMRERMKAMRMPGKVYGALLGEISRGFKHRKRKRVTAVDDEGGERVNPTTFPKETLDNASSEFGPGQEMEERSGRKLEISGGPTNTAKATKADNAAVPVYLWDEAICRGIDRLNTDDKQVTDAFDVMRTSLLLPFWKRKVVLDLSEWLFENKDRMTPEEYEKSAAAGRRAIRYVGKTTWWKWDAGSPPFFWRWPEEFQMEV